MRSLPPRTASTILVSRCSRCSIPTLPSLNIDDSIGFYHQIGFNLVTRNEDRYAIVSRDGTELHVFASDKSAENSGCYIYTGDVQALHTEFGSAGVDRLGEIQEKPWKTLEFEVFDPSGNLLRFGQSLAH